MYVCSTLWQYLLIFDEDCISIGSRVIDGPGSWRVVVGIGIVWPFILAIGILFMPESPRWLAKQGRLEEARHSVAITHGIGFDAESKDTLVEREVEEIRSNVEYEKTFSGGWIDCFKPGNKILYRTLLGMFSLLYVIRFIIVYASRHGATDLPTVDGRQLFLLLRSNDFLFGGPQ